MSPLGARFVRRVTRDHVGQRVTLRRRLPDGSLSDVVGTLEGWADDGVLTVRTRRDDLVSVDDSAVVASRVIPPRD